MSVLLIPLLVLVVPIVVLTFLWTVVSAVSFKKHRTKGQIFCIALSIFIGDLLSIIWFETIGSNAALSSLVLIPYVIGLIILGGLGTYFIDRKYVKWIILVVGAIAAALCIVLATPYIKQKYADLTPFYSADFQEYKPNSYVTSDISLSIEQESSWYSKALSFKLAGTKDAITEYQQDPSMKPSCTGILPASTCRSGKSPIKHITYTITQEVQSEEDINWMIGQTYFNMSIPNVIANDTSNTNIGAFIDSLVPVHYTSIPIRYSKEQNFG